MDDLMEIGRFAATSRLTIDALRHYDEIDILKPASVDPRTSYRRYSVDQLDDARLICSLRGVDLPVDEVRAVLESDGPPSRQGILLRHRQRLAERADLLEKMLATSEAFVDRGVPVPPPDKVRVAQVMVSTTDHHGSVQFYSEVFGFDFNPDLSSFILGAWQTESFLLLTIENWLDDATPSAFGLMVDHVDVRHQLALSHGATEVSPPTDYDFKHAAPSSMTRAVTASNCHRANGRILRQQTLDPRHACEK
jgi:DNA-binding transcriptional MerR regulator